MQSLPQEPVTSVQRDMARFGFCFKDTFGCELLASPCMCKMILHMVLLKSLWIWLLNFCKSEGENNTDMSGRAPYQLRSRNNLNFCTFSFRCFPGLFEDRRHARPSGSQLPKKRPGTKIQFFLLQSPSDKMRKSSEELTLLQAGLGRRTVNIPEDANHKEVCELI